jgi:3-methylcrotonyl-CoA carboxylase beta subunit
MSALSSLIDPKSEQFAQNAAHNRALADALRARVAQASLGGGDKARARHVSRGKLLPRDRVFCLLDAGSPFVELSALAANGMYNDRRQARASPHRQGSDRRVMMSPTIRPSKATFISR